MRGEEQNLVSLAAERLAAESASRKAASKYDYVKVKVRLGEQLEHYYILSRFLVSRMLTVTRIPQYKAVKIALELKKQLIDSERLEITQDELEAALFSIMQSKGFGDEYVQRFRMITQFYQEKRPLIVLIAGSACTGKSTLAQQLASRLNLPNVLQTDVLCELLRASGISPLSSTPLWERPLDESAVLEEFEAECAAIRRGLDGDLCKSIRDGKPIIIEGLHIDPAIYLKEFGEPARSTGDGSARQAGAAPPGVAGDGQGSRHQQQAQASVDTSDVEHLAQRTRRSLSLDETASAALYKQQSPWRQGSGAVGRRRPSSAQVSSRGSSGQVTFMLRSMSEERWLSPQITAGRDVPPLPRRLPASTQEESGGTNGRQSSREPLARSRFGESTDATVSAAARIETKAAAAAALPPPGAAAGPVFVPVVLSVPEEDYEALARDWYAGQRAAGAASSSDAGDDEEHLRAKVLPRLRALQQHLESREVLGVPVVRMGAGGFADAVDRLHEYVLECIALAQHQHRELTAGSGDGEEQEEQRV